MNPVKVLPAPDANTEVAALIETLHRAGQRLEELTAGEIDAVANQEGRAYMLPGAQELVRHGEAAKKTAILNALPACIALIDVHGFIVSVNDAWSRLGAANAVQGSGHGVGANYLQICDRAHGSDAAQAAETAAGIRSILSGATDVFSQEYSCDALPQRRWFVMTVTPLSGNPPSGAVVMHLDSTARVADQARLRESERRLKRLNRVHAVLSGINALIARVRDRDELFKGACRIAVDDGQLLAAWIGIADPGAMRIDPIASTGVDATFFARIEDRLSLLDDAPAGHGAAAVAVREKRAVVVNEVGTDPRVVHKGAYSEHGIHAIVNLPLLIADEAVGVFCLQAAEAGFFDEAELKLLTGLAGDISYAIDHIDKQERLDYLAYYDVLTGLANRRLFLERVALYMGSAVDGEHKLALFLVDLERFKSINDSLGQAPGDALLRQVGEWLVRNAGDATLVSRLGADHFAVVLPRIKPDGNVGRLLENSLKDFLEHSFRMDNAVFRIGAKVGVAIFPDDGGNADLLLKHAEAALKRAKAGGKRYLFYMRSMTETSAGALTLENKLRQALEKEEFVLHFQPKVNLASGKLTGTEALIRWNDPANGLVLPGQFIPVLEETGLIHEVGRWALRQAAEDYLRWRAAGLPAVRIAVNVSPLQLRDRGFIHEVRRAIDIDPRAAAGLELELTESLIMEDVKHSAASLQAIRALGVTIAIDDFGTGFSSLSYLAKLPVDTLKIDRSFVVDMTTGPQGLSLVSTIITLAHSLKLRVVAEGVETEEQSLLLRGLGCDEVQGYLFGKAAPAADFEARYLARP